ncbi:FtsQ-type POTRA domain-containing protein [Candidatus Profftia sp. (ex Adelges kitamiensis)]|uniref:FtsQ-type POTRA domain-containing protein n=1 Tax=Candidatus Profftia sp. (ex Adelges kitamiensis) TaxID=2864218 RepID=UPI001CE2B298|nr:FtsQ-type POTRA domain-containing protein [Candidatus Profftia sp. (ex Adelges kitamiensis)]
MSQTFFNSSSNEFHSIVDLRRNHHICLFSIVFLFIVLIVITISSWMLVSWIKESSRMLISTVMITGICNFTHYDDIRHAILLLDSTSNFITQDIHMIQQEIKRLPWIKQVNVRKQWPNILKIQLVEYVPIAYWNDLFLIDAKSKKFHIPVGRMIQQKIPLLYGPKGTENQVIAQYFLISKELDKHHLKLKIVSMNTRNAWQVCLENDIFLKLGRTNPVDRLASFEKIYPILQQKAKETDQRIMYIDLRYNAGAAVAMVPALITQHTSQTLLSNRSRHRLQ